MSQLDELAKAGHTTTTQVGWQLYRIWYETERLHESLDYQTPRQRTVTSDRTPSSQAALAGT